MLYHYVRVERDGSKWDWPARDWRASKRSHQRLSEFAGPIPYNLRRRESIRVNRKRIRRTLDDLRGKHAGATAYCILGGPSALSDLECNPPRPGDVVLGYNRTYTYWPLDYLLVADGIVDAKRHDEWGKPKGEKLPTLIALEWAASDLVDRWPIEEVYWCRCAGWGNEHSWLGVDQELPELEFILSGGTMMPHLADLLGCTQIVLVGADHAIAGTELYPGVRHQASPNNYYLTCLDRNGRTVWTTWEMWMAARKLEAWAYAMARYGLRFVNLTGGGIVDRWWEKTRQ